MQLGDKLAIVTGALGIPHCKGCEKRARALNSVFGIRLPEGHRLRAHGFRVDAQVLLTQSAAGWSTFLYDGKQLSAESDWIDEQQARKDFEMRMQCRTA